MAALNYPVDSHLATKFKYILCCSILELPSYFVAFFSCSLYCYPVNQQKNSWIFFLVSLLILFPSPRMLSLILSLITQRPLLKLALSIMPFIIIPSGFNFHSLQIYMILFVPSFINLLYLRAIYVNKNQTV